jgi:adenosylmethionine-8-amino-7-oxononanoate aminotransferase
LLERHAGEVAALIVEPLVQCAGGMRMHHPDYLREARRLCDAHGVHLIADEIAVGFGRTGSLFACAQAAITPDLMCVSKGITGGFLPLAATLVREPIYQAFLDARRERGFLHSHSYTGNPLACAAALASLALFRDEHVLERNQALAGQMGVAAATLREHPNLAEVRQRGLIVAFELSPDGSRHSEFPDALGVGQRAYRAALAHGVLLRPLGNVLYWMPPYCLQADELEHLARVTRLAIEAAVAA